jgi:hypothetical protein
MSREYTTEEVREKFLRHVNSLVEYWAREDLDSPYVMKDRLGGLAFSIMSALDGCSMNLPGFIVAPCPHEDDKEYAINNNEDYYPQFPLGDEKICDIAGGLHELLHKYE